MQKKLLTIIFILLNWNIYSQNFGAGFKLGISASQVGGDELAGFHKGGLFTGLFVNRSISNLIDIQMELTYIDKGSNNPNINNTEHRNYNKQDITLSYIEIPFLLKYKQSKFIEINGGIMTAYLLDGYYNDFIGKIDYTNTPPFKKYDFGILLGMNYKYSNKIGLNTRITNSIFPVGQEDSIFSNTYNSRFKGKYNSVIVFAINYTI